MVVIITLNFNFINTENFVSRNNIKEFYELNKETILTALHGNKTYSDFLGWHNPNNYANLEILSKIKDKSVEIQKESNIFIINGVGGSNQGARAGIYALDKDKNMEIIYAGNTLSAFEFSEIEKKIRNKDFHINIIAKNFETLEPGVSFRLLRRILYEKYGNVGNKRIIATGTANSHLAKLSKENNYDFFEFPDDICGRYSVLTNTNLLAMAVAGINIDELILGAKEMHITLLNDNTINNPIIYYAILRNILLKKGYKMELLSFFEPRLRFFAKWWVQLFAESEGKAGKGIYPIVGEYSEDLHSIGQYVQQGQSIIFESFLKIIDRDAIVYTKNDSIDDKFDYINKKDLHYINKIAEKATIESHALRLPCIEIEIDSLSAKNLGKLFYSYMLLCSVSAELLGVNPYNQDGVEVYKKSLFQQLRKS